AFERLDRGPPVPLWGAVWATGQEEFWALPEGGDGELVRHDAGGYHRVPLAGQLDFLYPVSPTEGWVVGEHVYHGDGVGFVETPLPPGPSIVTPYDSWIPQIEVMHAVGPREVWAARGDDQLLRWDGAAWQLVPTGTGGYLTSVWASGA